MIFGLFAFLSACYASRISLATQINAKIYEACVTRNEEQAISIFKGLEGSSLFHLHGSLNCAVFYGLKDVVKYLLKYGQVDKSDEQASFQTACVTGFEELVKVFLDHGIDPTYEDSKALIATSKVYQKNYSAKNGVLINPVGRTAVVKLLLEKGADPSARGNMAIKNAIEADMFDMVELFVADQRIDLTVTGPEVLLACCWNGHVGCVRALLSRGLNPNASSGLPFTEACRRDHIDLVQIMLANPLLDPSIGGSRALVEASKAGNYRVVRALLGDSRVDPADQDNKAIKFAALGNHPHIVGLLMNDARVRGPFNIEVLYSDMMEFLWIQQDMSQVQLYNIYKALHARLEERLKHSSSHYVRMVFIRLGSYMDYCYKLHKLEGIPRTYIEEDLSPYLRA